MSSKYDVVKLKVHLNSAHYYILSRFLLSKMLMFCRIPEESAVRISLEVKKHFVNSEQTCITQLELEAYLETAMTAFGFSETHTRLFPVVTQFHTERIPLVLFIAGPACRGKTTLAHLLSARLNCSTIINTEVLDDITASIDDMLTGLPRTVNRSTDSVSVPGTDSEAAVVAAVEAEVEKAVREGKVIIVEGERLRLAWVRRFLDAAFQKRAGAVIIGAVLDSLDTPASTAAAAYDEAVDELESVYRSDCVSVMCVGRAQRETREGEGAVPSVYIARCHAAGDNLEVCAYLHDVVVRRIVDELKRRNKMPTCGGIPEDSAMTRNGPLA